MGGNMIDKIVKTAYLRRLDQMTELRAQFDLQQVEDDFNPEDPVNPGMENPLELEELAKRYGVVVDPQSEKHVNDHWLKQTGTDAFFSHPRNRDILRRGLWEAVKLVRKLDKPIDSYWVCALYKYPNPEAQPIQVILAPNSRQITLFLVTPMPKPGGFIRRDPLIKIAKWDDALNRVIYDDIEE